MSSVAAVSKSCRKSKFVVGGLEFPKELTYHGWEPGGEYTLPLIFKNIKLTTQKLNFKLSSNLFTSPVSHQSLTLCAGTCFTLPIIFRPWEKNPCEGYVEFETGDGKLIKIPIKAVLPRPKLKLTEHLNFGMCAVKSSINVSFEISNVGNIPAFFNWKVPQNFNIIPKSGLLAPRETSRLNATFSPSIAKVYTTFATCSFSEKRQPNTTEESVVEHTKEMKLEGVGKYPHVIVQQFSKASENDTVTAMKDEKEHLDIHVNYNEGDKKVVKEIVIDFGFIDIGCSSEKWISVFNPSPVSCMFSVYSPARINETVTVYFCADYKKNIQPFTSTKVKLIYAPKVFNDFKDVGYFIVRADGGLGSTQIKCVGQSKGPRVSILNENSIVDFGKVECGKMSSGTVHITNQSDVPAIFQLQIGDSVFCCDVLNGTLEAFSNVKISVKFVPQHPIPYCRTISLIVQNQEPLFVHFIGTAFSETQKPALLEPNVILRYLEHAESGLTLMPPEQLKGFLKEEKLTTEQTKGTLKTTSLSELFVPSPPEKFTPYSSGYSRYMHSEYELSTVPHITIDVDEIKFGYCSPSFSSDSKEVTINNHTYGEVSCVWMTANLKRFVVLPVQRIIMPRKSASFTLYFKPDKSNQIYSREIECYVFYKDLIDSSRVNPLTVCPPWCLTVQLSGHTFARNFGNLLPELLCDTTDVIFPPTVAGQPTYQTVVISNPGNEPVEYDIPEDDDKIFTVKPAHGTLKNQFQLVTIQMLPNDAGVYKCTLEYQLHLTAAVSSKKLLLRGFSGTPNISMENDGRLYFKPTYIGTTSSKAYSIRNLSAVPLRFKWKHSNVAQSKILRIEPNKGTILPNESQEHMWYFTPMEAKEYQFQSILYSYVDLVGEVSKFTKSRTYLDIFGSGKTGVIQCTPSNLDYGIFIIGTSKHHNLALTNPGSCDLLYTLSVTFHSGDNISENEVELSPMSGVIYAWSTIRVKVTVQPSHSQSCHCTISYQFLSQFRRVTCTDESFQDKSHPLCEIKFTGTFPSLNIVDIQGQGSATQNSKAKLWKMLSIDEINKNLKEIPAATELHHDVSSRHSLHHKLPISTKTIIDCDFGAASLRVEDFIVSLMLKNDGAVSTKWAFLMSNDLWVDPELWADYGIDELESDEMLVLNNELFTVSPRRGTLKPGESIVVIITYKHSHVGTTRLPVLLKISNGREILLNFSGITLEKGRPYLHISRKHHYFDSVPIGIHAYPRQALPLYNGGDTVVGYEVDLRPLNCLTENSYFMPIFECLQPAGKILPRSTFQLEFIFSPVEAKRYLIDVPIYLSTGKTKMVTLVGDGYNHMVDKNQQAIDSDIPTSSIILVSGNVASLSQENVNFGCVPQFAKVRRIVYINNISHHTLSYYWDLDSTDINKVITVEPKKGYIQPGKSATGKLTFSSPSSSLNCNFDIICKVTNETELLSHQAAVNRWHKKNEDRKHALIITEDETQKRPLSVLDYQNEAKILGSGRPFSKELRGKLDRLPPIGISEGSYEDWKKRDLSNKRPTSISISCSEPPVPPKPLLLHLSVKAEAISVSDYVKLHGDVSGFHIDYHALASSENCSVHEVHHDELELQKVLLNQILKEILEDANFEQAVCRIIEEPIPFFPQFSTQIKASERSRVLSVAIGNPSQSHVDAFDTIKNTGFGKLHGNSSGKIFHEKSGVNKGNEVIDDDELYSIVEGTIENTISNIMNEANSSEFNVTNPLHIITKSDVI